MTPLTAAVAILYVPAVVTLTVIVCDTPDTAVPAVMVPVTAVLQAVIDPMTAVPPEDESVTARLKLQFGVVVSV